MQNLPPCCFIREPCSWAFLFVCFFKLVCQGALQTIMQKTNSFAIDFSDFAMSKSIKNESERQEQSIQNSVWGCPGGSRGRLGDHFGPRMAQGSKMGPKSRESLIHSGYQNQDLDQLFVVLFFTVFWGPLFLICCWFWMPGASISAPFLLYFVSSGPLGKQLKVL